MTNREFILADIAKQSDERLCEMWEDLYSCAPDAYPIKSYCRTCMENHGDDCPADVECIADVPKWMAAEAVPVKRDE